MDERTLHGIFAVDLAESIAEDAPEEGGLVVGKRIQLVPLGTFHHERYGKFTVDPAHVAQMIKNAARTGMDLLLDWEHKSSDPKAPVKERRASGWGKAGTFSVVDGWLTTVPKWTKEAADAIRKGEVRWISPEFVFDKLDKATGGRQGATLLAAALTNRPFLQGQAGVALSDGWGYDPQEGETEVDWKKLLVALKLKEDATEEDVAALVLGGGDKGDGDELTPFEATVARKLSELGWDGESDPAPFVAKLTLPPEEGTVTIQATELAAIKSEAATATKTAEGVVKMLAERDASDAVKLGMSEGKIPPAQEEFWTNFVLSNGVGAFTEHLKTCPVVVDLSEHGTGLGGEEPTMALADVEAEVQKLAEARVAAELKVGNTLSEADAWGLVLSENAPLHERLNQAMEANPGATAPVESAT